MINLERSANGENKLTIQSGKESIVIKWTGEIEYDPYFDEDLLDESEKPDRPTFSEFTKKDSHFLRHAQASDILRHAIGKRHDKVSEMCKRDGYDPAIHGTNVSCWIMHQISIPQHQGE